MRGLVTVGEAGGAGDAHVEDTFVVEVLIGDGRTSRVAGRRLVGRQVAQRAELRVLRVGLDSVGSGRLARVVVEEGGRVGHTPGVGELAVDDAVAQGVGRSTRQPRPVRQGGHAQTTRHDRAEYAHAALLETIRWADLGVDAPLADRQRPHLRAVREVDFEALGVGGDAGSAAEALWAGGQIYGAAVEVNLEAGVGHVDADAMAAHPGRDCGVDRDEARSVGFLSGLDVEAAVGRAEERELTRGLEVVMVLIDALQVRVAIGAAAA